MHAAAALLRDLWYDPLALTAGFGARLGAALVAIAVVWAIAGWAW